MPAQQNWRHSKTQSGSPRVVDAEAGVPSAFIRVIEMSGHTKGVEPQEHGSSSKAEHHHARSVGRLKQHFPWRVLLPRLSVSPRLRGLVLLNLVGAAAHPPLAPRRRGGRGQGPLAVP